WAGADTAVPRDAGAAACCARSVAARSASYLTCHPLPTVSIRWRYVSASEGSPATTACWCAESQQPTCTSSTLTYSLAGLPNLDQTFVVTFGVDSGRLSSLMPAR